MHIFIRTYVFFFGKGDSSERAGSSQSEMGELALLERRGD